MEGYAKLAALIGNQPDLAIFRKFLAANALNLAYLQADLMAVQTAFAKTTVSDQSSGDAELMTLGKYFAMMREAPPGRASQQLEKFQELQDEALLTFRRLCHLPGVNHRNLNILQNWLKRVKGGDNFLYGVERDVWHDEFGFDMTSLTTRPGGEDLITRLVNGPVLDAIHDMIGDQNLKEFDVRDQFFGQTFKSEFYTYSDTKIESIIAVFGTVLAALLPAMSIYLLSYVQSPSARRGVVLFLMTIFSGAMGLFARANGSDNFAASAAFAAVIVVFVVNSDFGASSNSACSA